MAPAQTVGDLVCLVRLGLPWVPVAGSTVGLVTAVCSKLVIYVIYVCMRYLTPAPSLRLFRSGTQNLIGLAPNAAKCKERKRREKLHVLHFLLL